MPLNSPEVLAVMRIEAPAWVISRVVSSPSSRRGVPDALQCALRLHMQRAVPKHVDLA